MHNNIAPDGAPRPVTRFTGGLSAMEPDGRSRRLLGDNGVAKTLAWSPEGERLYFADSRRKLIWRCRYEPEQPSLHDQEVFIEGGPGVADGFLWIARWGADCLIRYAPDGRQLQLRVETPVCPSQSSPGECKTQGWPLCAQGFDLVLRMPPMWRPRSSSAWDLAGAPHVATRHGPVSWTAGQASAEACVSQPADARAPRRGLLANCPSKEASDGS